MWAVLGRCRCAEEGRRGARERERERERETATGEAERGMGWREVNEGGARRGEGLEGEVACG